MRLKGKITLIICIVGLILLSTYTIATPNGAILDEKRSERGESTSADEHAAIAGNVTELDISGTSITQSWQGYFGNVSGIITLDDASNNTLYNWSLASPEGEVYATNGTVVTWTNIQCFNLSAVGLQNTDSAVCNETLAGGTTSLCGKNATELEEEFGLVTTNVDGVDETFNHTWSVSKNGHDLFYVGNYEFSAGECTYTTIFGDTGEGVDGEFEEVLLWDPDQNNTIFTALIENDALGFDNTPKDFQMMVLENGHGTDTSTTNYWFYVEIE